MIKEITERVLTDYWNERTYYEDDELFRLLIDLKEVFVNNVFLDKIKR